jgi:hypothetical protein
MIPHIKPKITEKEGSDKGVEPGNSTIVCMDVFNPMDNHRQCLKRGGGY